MKASVILFLIIMLPLSLLGQQKDKLEKLWAAYHKTDQDIERIDCLIKIGREFNSNEGKTDSAKVIFEEALELANNGQDKLTIYRVLNQLGMTHVYLGNTVIADSLLNIALKGLKSLGNENGIASVYSHLSACYDLKGDFKKASHFSKVALDLYIELKDSVGIINQYSNLGDIYRLNNKIDSSIYFQLEGVKLIEQLTTYPPAAQMYADLSASYMTADRYEQGLKYAKRALEISTQKNLLFPLFCSYERISDYYFSYKENLDSALFYLDKAINVANKMQNKEPVTASHYNLGHILFNNDMLQQSEKHFDSTVTLAKEFGPEVLHGLGLQGRAMVKYKLGDKSYKSDLEESFSINKDDLYYLEGAYQTMYTLAKEKNDFEMALDFLEQQNVVSDSINSKEVQEKISKSNERLATFKKEQELKVKEQELRLERRRILLAVFAIGILIVFLIFVFRLYQEIKKQKNYIDLLHKELTHRVAQIFSAVSTYIIYTKKKGGSFSDLQDRIKTLFNIFKLIQETGSHTAKELKEYLNAVTDEIRQSFLYDKDIKTKIEVTAGIGNKYVTLLNVTIAELYTNSLKYGFIDRQKGTVYISFSRIDKEYLLIVKDDGISKPDDFSNPKGTGIGIDVIRRLVEKQFDGTIDISHTKGTAVTIRFPDNPD